MTTSAPKWDELVPLPAIFDPNARVEFLKLLLVPGNPHYQSTSQYQSRDYAV